ncbi:hypothetical protein GQ457_06G031190 [Hibiscus cannabinus]
MERKVLGALIYNYTNIKRGVCRKVAEEEYGFDQKGTITIPCLVQQFRDVRNLIDRDKSLLFHHHRHHHVECFRV